MAITLRITHRISADVSILSEKMNKPKRYVTLIQKVAIVLHFFTAGGSGFFIGGQDYTQCYVTLDIGQCFHSSNDTANVPDEDICHADSICSHEFSLSKFGKGVYGIEIVEQLLHRCCGSCTNTTKMSDVQTVSHLRSAMMEKVDMVFPVLGKEKESRLHGYYFIPLVEAPQVYYITHANHHLMRDTILSLLNLWPFLIVTAVMVLISGFICWLMETWGNKEEFPRSFLIGWFEGVWWSFISMTTVGYGDKAPKSVHAKIFSIIWIIIGIVIFSLITAALTSVIVAINSSPPPTMEDANVGVINHHLHESMLVANQGGIVIDIHSPNMTDGIHQMVQLLCEHKIDGFVVDRYALILFYALFSDHPLYGHDITYIKNDGLLTEVKRSGDGHMYGILLKQRQHFYFLDHFVRSNRAIIDSCNRLFLNKHSRIAKVKNVSGSFFSSSGELFWPTMCSLVAVLVVIILTGVAYELRKVYKHSMKKKAGTDLKYVHSIAL